MLELKDILWKKNDKVILDSLSLTFFTGKLYALTGPNGSGKSTLAKIIMGIEKPTSGKIIFNKQDITSKSISARAKLGISYAFQQPVKFKGVSAGDLLSIALNKSDKSETSQDYLKQVGLDDDYYTRELSSELSGGELKRIELASILAKNPQLAIFDEPEAGIDLWSFASLVDIFHNLKGQNKTTLVVSHQEKILEQADEILLLENGKIKIFDTYDKFCKERLK